MTGSKIFTDFEVYADMAAERELPGEFDEWTIANPNGWTVAHVAARAGFMPPSFDQWHLADDDGVTVAHVAAEFGHLSENFSQWDMANPCGWAVAHEAAKCGTLPENFNQWDIANSDGLTVALVAAQQGHLTKNFDRWDLLPKEFHPGPGRPLNKTKGRTMNEYDAAYNDAAYKGLIQRIRRGETLPLETTDWRMANGLGWTLAHEAAKLGKIPAGFRRDQWNEVDDFQNPVANIAARFGMLPDDFKFWDIRDDIGNTPGHVAAINGKAWMLPPSFDAWDVKNDEGKTVRELETEHEERVVLRMAEREARNANKETRKPKVGM